MTIMHSGLDDNERKRKKIDFQNVQKTKCSDENIRQRKYSKTPFCMKFHREFEKDTRGISEMQNLCQNQMFVKSTPTFQLFYLIQSSKQANRYTRRYIRVSW